MEVQIPQLSLSLSHEWLVGLSIVGSVFLYLLGSAVTAGVIVRCRGRYFGPAYGSVENDGGYVLATVFWPLAIVLTLFWWSAGGVVRGVFNAVAGKLPKKEAE